MALKIRPKAEPQSTLHSLQSITGLDRGGAHGRRDIVKDGSRTEQRRAGLRADESESELAGGRSDMESNRKSRVDNHLSVLLLLLRELVVDVAVVTSFRHADLS